MIAHACTPDLPCALCGRRVAELGTPPAPAAPRRGLCQHLGKRTEFRAGCGGNFCRHECLAGEPFAVPGGVCQTCPRFDPQ